MPCHMKSEMASRTCRQPADLELEPVAKKYILANLGQNAANKNGLTQRVKTFSEDTGLELNLANFLKAYDMSLYDFYHASGSRSLFRLKKWAGLITDDRDVENQVYQKFSAFSTSIPKGSWTTGWLT